MERKRNGKYEWQSQNYEDLNDKNEEFDSNSDRISEE